MMVYIAGAIDLAEYREVDPREAVRGYLSSEGHVCYCPWAAFDAEAPFETSDARAIKAINLAAIDSCDVVVVVLDGTFTWGTVVDAHYAMEVGVPVIVLWWDLTGRPVPAYLAAEYDIVMTTTELPARLAALSGRPRVPAGQRVAGAGSRGSALALPVALWPEHPTPAKSYPSDAGIDLTVLQSVVVHPHSWADISTGARFGIPIGYFGLILGRSSTFYKKRLQVHTAVIDAGYEGEMRVAVYNPTDDAVMVQAGERLAQLIVIPIPHVNIEVVEDLPIIGERGERGFGSSGA